MSSERQKTCWDKSLIISTLLLVFALPMMFFNPMDPLFHHLQIADGFFLLSCFLLSVVSWRNRDFHCPKPGLTFYSLTIWLVVVSLSALMGLSPKHSALGLIKLGYLSALATVIYIVGYHYRLTKLYWCSISLAFLIVLFAGVLGISLLYFGVSTALATQTRIIPIALGIENWIQFIPRVTSLLLPTANMLGAYLAGMSLPVYVFLLPKIRNRFLRVFLLGLILGLGLLTMSRTFVGVLLAGYFICRLPSQVFPGQLFFRWVLLTITVIAWFMLLFYSIWYPVDLHYAYTQDNTFQKPIVMLREGDSRPNPVYFLRHDRGLETVALQFSYGWNHYAWLKYGALQLGLQHPWFGVGMGNYALGIAKLAKDNKVPAPLSAYQFAQSQYFTSFAEWGSLGLMAFLGLLGTVLRGLYQAYCRNKDHLSLAILLAFLIVAWVAIDLDVLFFRWLWGLAAVGLLACHQKES